MSSLDNKLKIAIAYKKFLTILSVVFLLVVLVLWWQESNKPQSQVIPVNAAWKSFSQLGVRTDYVSDYRSGAIYIHDLETVPGIKELFFDKEKQTLLTELIDERAMIEVQKQRAKATVYNDDLVYHTSYYIGNLPIHPTLTLYDLLSQSNRPATAVLLQTILADVRAGAVKLQDYFDVAPPYYYDEGLATKFYYNAPSFPSLTTAEAMTVWLVLAELDKPNARIYELQARTYLEAMLQSGAHYMADVEYGAHLAGALVRQALAMPSYQALFAETVPEWTASYATELPPLIKLPFSVPVFPYQSEFNVVYTRASTSSLSESSNEVLGGTISLSLKDQRVPGALTTLYDYAIASNQVVPFATDLQAPKYPTLESGVYSGRLIDANQYVFVSDQADLVGEVNTSSIYLRVGETVSALASAKAGESYAEPALNLDRKKLLFTKTQTTDLAKTVQLLDLSLGAEDNGRIEMVAQGYSAVFGPRDEYAIYLDETGVMAKKFKSDQTTSLVSWPKTDGASSYQLTINRDRNLLLVLHNSFDPEIRRQQAWFDVYRLTEGELLEAVPVGKIWLRDATAYGAVISAGGKYLAVGVSETVAEQRPRLLIFDLNNGIIQKELNLQSFSPMSIKIDEWI